MKRLPVLGLMASLLVTSSAAWSQEAFPDRPVRVLVSAGAGGGTDIVTRLLAQSLSAAWKQPVVVENR
ncbi:MAG: tripartite tricarboxylate transporter substrate binding protein, partial [Proteobacteria bacterium]|nr:tripartite tricarboxylate transporter substrate binding protein [Pseudomonadota bacterium]